jgi:hypothetical protein
VADRAGHPVLAVGHAADREPSPALPAQREALTGRMDLRELVAREGGVVTATGRVLAADGDVWFERPGPVVLP